MPNSILLETDKIIIQDNDRRNFDVTDLVLSIEENGIISPLLVHLTQGQYVLIAGGRRIRAARELKLEQVPVIVYEGLSEREVAEIRLTENLNRSNLNHVEEARAILSHLHSFLVDFPTYERMTAKIDEPLQKAASILFKLRKNAPNKQAEIDLQKGDSGEMVRFIIATFEKIGINWRTFADTKASLISYPDDVLALIENGLSLDAARAIKQVDNDEMRSEVVKKVQKAIQENVGVAHKGIANQAIRDTLGTAQAIKKVGDLQRSLEEDKSTYQTWHLPHDDASTWSQLPPANLHEFWQTAAPVMPVYPIDVPYEIYVNLLATYAKQGDRILSVQGGASSLIEIGTEYGMAVAAVSTHPLRNGIIFSQPNHLEIQDMDLTVVHLPPFLEQIARRFGEKAEYDISSLIDWAKYCDHCAEWFVAPRTKRIAVISRAVKQYGRIFSIGTLINVAMRDKMIGLHYFLDGSRDMWTIAIGDM